MSRHFTQLPGVGLFVNRALPLLSCAKVNLESAIEDRLAEVRAERQHNKKRQRYCGAHRRPLRNHIAINSQRQTMNATPSKVALENNGLRLVEESAMSLA